MANPCCDRRSSKLALLVALLVVSSAPETNAQCRAGKYISATVRLSGPVRSDGDRFVVGSPRTRVRVLPAPWVNDAGVVVVYERNGCGWVETVRLNASDAAAQQYFGSSLDIEGDTLVVGAPSSN